jgi:glucose-1-phosphate thymidylyltransferase
LFYIWRILTPSHLVKNKSVGIDDLDLFIINRLPEIDSLQIVTNNKFYGHFQKWAEKMKEHGTTSIPVVVHNDGTSSNADRLGAVADLHYVLERAATTMPMLVSAADNIFLFPIDQIWRYFLAQIHHLIVAIREKDPDRLQRTGVLELDENKRVLRLHEKPGIPPSTWSCPPLYFLQPSACRHLETLVASETALDASGHFIDYLCRREPVMARIVNGSRLDIGNAVSYHDANQILRQAPLLPR